MKKIFIALVLALSVSVVSNAVEMGSTSASDNGSQAFTSTTKNSKLFSIQVGGGVNIGFDRFKEERSKWIVGVTPAADFILGINPVDGFGIRIGYLGFKATDKITKFNWSYLHADFAWNITDMKCVSSKHFIAKPYVEVGAAFAKATSLGIGAGIVLGYRINKTFDIVFDGRASYFGKGDAFRIGTKQCGVGSATINLVANF